MAIYFVDSSALVKRYISEIGSEYVLGLFDPAIDNQIFIAAITGVEIIAAITRRSRRGNVKAGDATTVCNQFRVLLNSGMNSPPNPQFWGSRISQSPPELGDLGGEETCNLGENSYLNSATPIFNRVVQRVVNGQVA